jgi:hypothetical protein
MVETKMNRAWEMIEMRDVQLVGDASTRCSESPLLAIGGCAATLQRSLLSISLVPGLSY